MHKPQLQVQEFHREVLSGPTSPAEPKLRNEVLRANLILEEAIETAIALVGSGRAQTLVQEQLRRVLQAQALEANEPSLVEALDGICDLLYVAYGAAETLGIDIEPFFDEVHRSNMAKAGGELRADGKLLKPKSWTPPDLNSVLERVRSERARNRAGGGAAAMGGMSDTLKALIVEMERVVAAGTLPPNQMPGGREQRISWVYGNCKLENENITREMVERAVDEAEASGSRRFGAK